MLTHKFFHRAKKIAITDKDLKTKDLRKKREREEKERVRNERKKREKAEKAESKEENEDTKKDDAESEREDKKKKKKIKLDMHLEQVSNTRSEEANHLYIIIQYYRLPIYFILTSENAKLISISIKVFIIGVSLSIIYVR